MCKEIKDTGSSFLIGEFITSRELMGLFHSPTVMTNISNGDHHCLCLRHCFCIDFHGKPIFPVIFLWSKFVGVMLYCFAKWVADWIRIN